MEVLVTPDVEAVAVAWLRKELSARGMTATVATKVPSTMPANMVRVSVTGGSRRDRVTDRPRITVECWSGSSVAAGDLARLSCALLLAAAGETINGVWVRSTNSVGLPASFPDPDTNNPRYQFTVGWQVRPVAA